MKTAFPFSTFQRQQQLSPAVQVTKPLPSRGIREMRPGIVVNFFEPLETLRIAGQRITLDQTDQRLDMYPPEFLIPLQLLRRLSFAIQKVIDSAKLLIPAIFQGIQHNFYRLLCQFWPFQPDGEIHHEPHGFDRVTGIE